MNKLLLGIGLAAMINLMAWPAAVAKDNTATTAPRKALKVKPPKTPVNTGYGETRAERDRRLLRECKGRPNAGACEGFSN